MPKQLSSYDIIIAIDKSGSMANAGAHGKSRWEEAQETVLALAKKADTFDTDGITVIPFANTHKVYNGVTADKVAQVFAENEPNGGTDTASVLSTIFAAYQDAKKVLQDQAKPILVVVVTDGEPNDREAVKTVLREFAKGLTDNGAGDTDEAGILFLQVGNDPQAKAFLTELDDSLNARFDIVDTKTMDELEGISLTDALLQALDDQSLTNPGPRMAPTETP